MTLDILSKTPVEISGWSWSILEHILALSYITLFVLLISKWLKFKQKHIKYAFYISIILVAISLLVESTIPLRFVLFNIVLIFVISIVLIYYFYKEGLKKSFIAGLILIGLILAADVIVGIVNGIILAFKYM